MKKGTASKITRFLAIGTVIVSIILIVSFINFSVEIKRADKEIYSKSVELFEQGKYTEGFNKLHEIPNFENYAGVDELLEKYHICAYCGSIGSVD